MEYKEYKILSGQTIFDIAISTNGIDNIYELLLSNTMIKSISNVTEGLEINYIPAAVIPAAVKSKSPSAVVISENYYSINNQSVLDVCLMTYGDLNETYSLISTSSFYNLQTRPSPNTLFKFNPLKVSDNVFKSYLSNKKITINTATDFAISGALSTDDGVDISTDDGLIITVD